MCVRTLVFVFLICAMADGSANAQEKQEEEEGGGGGGGSRVQKFQEIEHGFWFRSGFGTSFSVGKLFEDEQARESPIWPPGPWIGVEAGVDLGQVGSIYLGVSGIQVSGTKIVSRGANSSKLSNDADGLQLMVGGRFALLTTKRTSWFLKAGAGFMFTAPALSELKGGVVVQGGGGLEYATNLRHFFVGLEAGAQYVVASAGVLAVLSPTLRYVF